MTHVFSYLQLFAEEAAENFSPVSSVSEPSGDTEAFSENSQSHPNKSEKEEEEAAVSFENEEPAPKEENFENLISFIDSSLDKIDFINSLKEKRALSEYRKIYGEAERLSSEIPGFSLKGELSDRRFSSLISSGFSVEEAFRAVHFEEILSSAVENAANTARAEALRNIKAFSERPAENGIVGSSPVKSRKSVDSLTGKGIRDILRRVERGAKVKF